MRMVRIKISGHGVGTDAPSVDDLFDQLRDYIDILRGVEAAIAEDGQNAIDWRVIDAGKSSPVSMVFGAFPRQYAVNIDRRTDAVLQRTAGGLATLRTRAERPPYFTDHVLQRARRTFERVTNGLDLTEVQFGGLPPLTITPTIARQAANNARVALTPLERPYRELGSIDGLTQAAESDGFGRKLLYVKNRLNGESVKCILSGQALEVVQEHRIAEVYRPIRIRIFGVIYYRGLGRVFQMEGNTVEFVPPRSELPSVDDILDETFTGGLRSEDYLDRLRDGQLS
jgi:hypothetical protein